ncbi:MAG: hypothetical protein AB199_03800 [Parcubacteria bacterium C7867-004]|nr:MAG: hypothetical protein AB199_03800 [Parcubacteria bacterium C7867-004]
MPHTLDTAQAALSLLRYAQARTTFAAAMLNIGECAAARSDIEALLSLLESFLELDRPFDRPLYLKLLQDLGKPIVLMEVIEAEQSHVLWMSQLEHELRRSAAFAACLLGAIEVTNGDMEAAVGAFEKALKFKPGYHDAKVGLAHTQARLKAAGRP